MPRIRKSMQVSDEKAGAGKPCQSKLYNTCEIYSHADVRLVVFVEDKMVLCSPNACLASELDESHHNDGYNKV